MKKQTFYIILFFLITGWSCNNKKNTTFDTPNSGTIHISVDESFQPLIDTEISVFQALNPKAHIIAEYKSEGDCFKDLINDSARLIIVTRDLNPAEAKYFKEIHMPIRSKALARDAVALIVNPANTDTLMTMHEIRNIMDGKDSSKKYSLVFDEQNSSLVRYVIDSINHGQPLPSYAMAANGCANVVDYVSQHKNALGVIGVSWVSNPFDSTGLSFLQKIRVVGIMGDSTYNYLSQNPGFNPHDSQYISYYFKPYQAYIAFHSYPLTRTVYFVLRQPYFGLGTGFANFLGGNKGQMIIGKERLYPLNLNIQIQQATIE
ncbi:MAG: PstS family phosphate ABC transporter substrate-binding protein [Chitinophagaceae bacterium]